MFEELKAAYTVLRDPVARTEYDVRRRQSANTAGQQTRRETPPHPPSPPKSPPSPRAEYAPPPGVSPQWTPFQPGTVVFNGLPKRVRNLLLLWQNGKRQDAFCVRLSSAWRNINGIAFFLLWFVLLYIDARWYGLILVYTGWFAVVTLAVAAGIVVNSVQLARRMSGGVGHSFFITSLYFVETSFGTVSFWPIWQGKVDSTTRAGDALHMDVSCVFDGRAVSFTIDTKREAIMQYILKLNAEAALDAAKRNDIAWFAARDLFAGAPRTEQHVTASFPTGKALAILGVCAVFCGGGFWMARTAAPALEPPASATPSIFDTLKKAGFTPQEPEEKPSIFDTLEEAGTPSPLPLPASGKVWNYTKEYGVVPLEIKAAQGSHYFVKLVDADTGIPVVAVFVRGGDTVEINVPLGQYEIRYAGGGSNWYGHGGDGTGRAGLFGKETVCSRCDKLFWFRIENGRSTGYTITLYRVVSGNLSTSQIKREDF